MPQFHFTTSDAATGIEKDSCDLPDVHTARRVAIMFAGEVLREIDRHIYDRDLHIVVTDEAGLLCWDLKVSGVEGPGAAGLP